MWYICVSWAERAGDKEIWYRSVWVAMHETDHELRP